ncbi:universal stress protein [Amycolatopsis sacchari]|uniref:Nucleotide-binding universal stress protein, UspA family n=1 Tax=Amycolatopsis sacchari TaxID=115433 RepID=A0A1I3KXE0_9PSEU|nr:universal stress protein [Amycolatopsis sacchari]SFI77074.1 Nucleotide-binding universal stress protein, UspA family [Amycolatopsis sacchari]
MVDNNTGMLAVGVDAAPGALHAARWAAREAVRRHRGLRLVHATDERSLHYPRGLPVGDDLLEVVRMRGHRLLRAARDAVREVAPELPVELVLSREAPGEVLLDESKAAPLLVLGTPGLRPLARVFAGSLSIALSAHAACPVALVRGHAGDDEPPSEGPVVVGVDGSSSSEEAVAIAFEEASWRDVPLMAVHAWDDAFLSAVFEETHWTPDEAAVEARESEVLAERLAGWQEKFPEVAVERVITRGRPSAALLDVADRAQLLVVGSRGRGGFSGLLLGSTSQGVMSYALCPVLVARHRR